MKNTWIPTVALAVWAAAGAMTTTAAEAAVVDCAGIAGIGDAVSPNAGCNELLGVNNDDAAAMNAAPAFGITTWTFLGRDNWDPEIGDVDIFDTGDAITGTFSFAASLIAGYADVALVLKSGATADPCAVIAYRLQPGQTTGSFDSPFLCPGAGQPQEISHLTLYGANLQPVPLPAGAVLMLSGAAGLALMRRRRRAAA
jgi:hypothetical protein